MSNIIDFDDYALAKDPENEWVDNYSEMVRPYLRWNHLDLELELAATHYYRAINGIGDKDWTYDVDCYLGVPDHIGLFFEINESYVSCLKIPLGFLVQLGLITGKAYSFSLVLERKQENEDDKDLMLVHTDLFDFFQEWIGFDQDVQNAVPPWDDDHDKFKAMYIDNAEENAWAKKQHIALRLNNKDHEDLKTRIVHQVLSVAVMLVDESDLLISDLYKRRGDGQELSETYSYPNVDNLWELGLKLEDFNEYFTEKQDFIGHLKFEVEFWSPETIWMIKVPERKRRWEYAKLALQNSDIAFDPLDLFEDD